MPSAKLPLLGVLALATMPFSAEAAFDGDFRLVDESSPAGLYTVASEVPTLGNWALLFAPSSNGTNYVDTSLAPASVTLGAENLHTEFFEQSKTTLFIELPLSGRVCFTVVICNIAGGNGSTGLEYGLSGGDFYALTDTGSGPEGQTNTYHLSFDVSSGQTLEFRSFALSAGTASFAQNRTTISNFVFEASPIPEPASFAVFAGLAALGFAGRRRRAAA